MASSIITSVVTGGTNSHQTVAEELNTYATDFVAQGVVGTIAVGSGSTAGTGSFAVTQDSSPDMGVTVLSGQAYVSGTPTGQDAQVLRARMTANYTSYTINANSSGSTKYDWIYLQLSATNANTPSSAADNVITLYTSRSSSNASDNGSPPTYGLLLAVVTVVNGASSITNANIADKRVSATIGSSTGASATGWNALSYPLTYGVNNGNKEFTVTAASDLTGFLSPGMKLSVKRSTTPPTQCMSFTAASSQYATKASPSGITFTSAFTCEAWVYLNSYTGQNQGIIGRYDGSANGFLIFINGSGQVVTQYASAGNTSWTTYQSIPLKRWVHIAGAVSSTTGKTLGGIYINGVSVPNSQTASVAAGLTQSSNLTVGSYAAGAANSFFDGYISEARVWSVAQSQASIQANMAINCVGNETNLVALFQGSGNFNDATSNANNLTATNGAIPTQASNPYNATEYALVRSVTYSNPTTTVTLFTDDAGTIPNQTLNSPSYSTSTEPYGWPKNLISDKVWGTVIWCANQTTTATATGTQLTGATLTFTVPTNGKKFVAKMYAGYFSAGAGQGLLDLYNGAVQVGEGRSVSTAGQSMLVQSAPFVASSGSQTFSVDMWETNAGTCTLGAATANPAWFTVEEA